MFNAHHETYQSTRFEEGLRIRRPTHHPRLQESLLVQGSFEGVDPSATIEHSKQGLQPYPYTTLLSGVQIPDYTIPGSTIDSRSAHDARTATHAFEEAAPLEYIDLPEHDYGYQSLQSDHSLSSSDYSWQGPSPASEMGNSSYAYESQGPSANLYNDTHGQGGTNFQDTGLVAYVNYDIPQASDDERYGLNINDVASLSAGPSQYPHHLLESSSVSAAPLTYPSYTDGTVESGYGGQLYFDQIQDQPMAGWNAADHFSGVVAFEDMKQPSRLSMGDNCSPQLISRERQFVDNGPRNFFRQEGINHINVFDLHTGVGTSTSSRVVTERHNTERDTAGQSKRPGVPGGIEEMGMGMGEQRAYAPYAPSYSPAETAARARPPTGSIRRWKSPAVAYPHDSMEYPLGSSRHQGFKILEPCDPSVPTARKRGLGQAQKEKAIQ